MSMMSQDFMRSSEGKRSSEAKINSAKIRFFIHQTRVIFFYIFTTYNRQRKIKFTVSSIIKAADNERNESPVTLKLMYLGENRKKNATNTIENNKKLKSNKLS